MARYWLEDAKPSKEERAIIRFVYAHPWQARLMRWKYAALSAPWRRWRTMEDHLRLMAAWSTEIAKRARIAV